ncbi:MAG: hypothetical protein IE916_04755 [Epsilonproteobacteria bacterium]|nr:hypothetical protein [Campylobacterota bacterium]
MRKPRGFGKNYFTLSSILAYSVSHKLQSQAVRAHEHFGWQGSCEDTDEESPPDDILLTSSVLQNDKPCHCNCIFKIRIRLILLLNHFIPRCPYYTTHFAFRRSGVHPPFSPFFI